MHFNKKVFLSITILLALVAIVYIPSLTGGFIYDDFWSLQKLSEINGTISLESLSAYLISSDTGPLKRPLSMLTFLMNAQEWPANAYSFRVTNLVIHLVNSLLLFLLILSILKIKNSNNYIWIALITTLLWALHPFLVSTVAYVVQRMAMLPVFFFLLSMFLYLKLRIRYEKFSFLKLTLYLLFIVYGLSALAALSKENGLLILLYIPLFEYLICQKYLKLTPMKKNVRNLFSFMPVVLLVLAFVVKFPDFTELYEFRDFGMYERLISESRALTKYLFHWIVPSVMTEGIYTDTFTASSSLLSPVSTIFSIMFIMVLIIVATKLRNKLPLVSFAILFYFISHLIESTVIPLQLYFEHRNYAAFLFLSLPLVMMVSTGLKNKKLVNGILLSLIMVLVLQTYLRSTLWGDSNNLKIRTLEVFPESIRARIAVVEMLDNKSNYQNAILILEQGIDFQEAPSLIAYKLKIKCQFEGFNESGVQQLVESILNNGLKEEELTVIGKLIQTILNNQCVETGNKLSHVEDILAAIYSQLKPESPLGWSMYYYASGRIAHKKKDYKAASYYFIKSFQQDKGYDRAIMAVSQLLNSDQPELALEVLEVVAFELNDSYIVNDRLHKEINRYLKLCKEEITAKNEDVNHNPS